MSSASANAHAALMDNVYRGQRHIYDFTRKYYLFGRDTLIRRLDARPGSRILEIACGTGRNLAKIRKMWPDTRLYGVDISEEMLKSASRALRGHATLGQGDACHFNAQAVLGEGQFDRVICSYSLSMIPDWEGALAHSATLLAPGGSLHIVDFGDLAGLPSPAAGILRGWLARFHVAPRTELAGVAAVMAKHHGLLLETHRGPMGYFQHHILRSQP